MNLRLLALFACLLLVPPAMAVEYQGMSVSRILAAGHESEATAGFVAIHADPDGDEADLRLHLNAATVEGTLYERRYISTGADAVVEIGQAVQPQVTRHAVSWEAAEMQQVTAGRSAQITLEGTALEVPRLIAGESEIRAVDTPYYDELRGLGSGVEDGATEDPEDWSTFRNRYIDGAWVLGQTSAPGFEVALDGDFEIELRDIDLIVRSASGEETITTRPYEERYHALQPDGTAMLVRTIVEPFLRISLDKADATVAMPLLQGTAYWLADEQATRPMGHVTLQDAQGAVIIGGEKQTLTGEDVTLREPSAFTLAPNGQRMALAGPVTTAAASGLAMGPIDADTWVLTALAVGLLLAAIAGLYFLVRRPVAARLQRVEHAIEKGSFDRAAKLAGRVLAKDPADERAAVARAVALSKAGHHGQVIEELEPRLAAAKPTDGVLHYLAGLAHMNQGAKGKANRLLRQAADLTPSLNGAVTNLLPDRRDDGYV